MSTNPQGVHLVGSGSLKVPGGRPLFEPGPLATGPPPSYMGRGRARNLNKIAPLRMIRSIALRAVRAPDQN